LNTVEFTRKSGLCTSCGACRAVCPKNSISMVFENGQFVPEIDKKTCVNCAVCLNVCAGHVIFPEKLRAKTPSEIIFEQNNFIESYNTYTKNENIRNNSTSGGIITTLLTQLLENNECDSVFTVNFSNFDGNQVFLEETSIVNDVLHTAGSKYVPVSAEKAIEAIRKNPYKKYAMVVTPCLLESVKNALKFYNINDDNILYLGLFCHKTLNFNAVKYFEYKYRQPGEKLVHIDYRTKEKFGWPGYTRLRFSSGREKFVHENERMLCKTFFQLKRCLYCLDKFNSGADISFGDGYLEGEHDSKGKSNIIIRTKKGKHIFDKYSDIFYREHIDLEEIKVPQNFVDERKERLRNTVIFAEKSGIEIPQNLKGFANNSFFAQRLAKKLKYISWGEKKSFLKIRLKSIMMKLSENSSIVWHTDTFKFAILFLTGLIVKLRQKIPKDPHSGENIIIVGGELFNKGAQAMSFTTIDTILRKFPDKKIYFFSKFDYERPDFEKNMYNFEILPWDISLQARIIAPWTKFVFREHQYTHLEPKIRNVIDNAYCIIDISGFGLSSQFGDTKSFFYMMNIVTAKNSAVPYYVMPQSMGPFDYSRSRKIFLTILIKIYLKYPKKIFLRENESISEAYYYTSGNIVKSPDIVLLNTNYLVLNIYKTMPQFKGIIAPADSVAVIPSMRITSQSDQNTVYGLYKDIISNLLEAKKKVYLLRHSFEDLVICRKLKNLFSDTRKVVYLNEDFNCIELEKIISQFDFIIASRYHSIIHAYKNGVPSYVIGWATKYPELMEMFGQSDYFFDMRKNPDRNKMIQSLNKIISDFSIEKKKILTVLTTLENNRNPFDNIWEYQPLQEKAKSFV